MAKDMALSTLESGTSGALGHEPCKPGCVYHKAAAQQENPSGLHRLTQVHHRSGLDLEKGP